MDTKAKADSLHSELVKEIEHYHRLARWAYRFAVLLMILTLSASAAAGLGGIFFEWKSPTVGAVALLPGVLSLVATVLKPQGRANWHYRKKASLESLRRKLMYELAEPPLEEDIRMLSEAWSNLDLKMDQDWEKNFALNWSPFAKHPK